MRVTVCSSPALEVRGDTGCFCFVETFSVDNSSGLFYCSHAFSIWYLHLSQTARGRVSSWLNVSLNTASKMIPNLPVMFLFLFLSMNSKPHVRQKSPEVFIVIEKPNLLCTFLIKARESLPVRKHWQLASPYLNDSCTKILRAAWEIFVLISRWSMSRYSLHYSPRNMFKIDTSVKER